jgi:hypothetical protein
MAELTDVLQWPFEGRILRSLGDDLLDRAWVFLRSDDGLAFIRGPFPPSGQVSPWPALPKAALDLLEPYRVRFLRSPVEVPPTPTYLLGWGTNPARLSGRASTMLSDYLLMMTPTADDLRDVRAENLRCGIVWLTHMLRVLYSQLYRNEITLSGLRWPLSPTPIVRSVTAETLPGWQLDLATDFARLIGTDNYLCDLRILPLETNRGTGDPAPRPASHLRKRPGPTTAPTRTSAAMPVTVSRERRQTVAENDALDEAELAKIMAEYPEIPWRDPRVSKTHHINKQFADRMPDLPGERPAGWKRKAQRLTDALKRWQAAHEQHLSNTYPGT